MIDEVRGQTLRRSYNLFGQLLLEMNPCGLHLEWKYDSLGRCSFLKLHDGSSIHYTYQGKHLTHVKRLSSTQTLLYEHEYTDFDVNGHVQQEKLIFDLGTLKTSHDLLERAISQTSPWRNSKYHKQGQSQSLLVTYRTQ
jgi:hypothetical protein